MVIEEYVYAYVYQYGCVIVNISMEFCSLWIAVVNTKYCKNLWLLFILAISVLFDITYR